MSIPYGVKASARATTMGVDEGRGPSLSVWVMSESRDYPPALGVACRDVMAEVRNRMARRGYQWD